MPSVSVIIPTYNRAEWIGEAVGSVLHQTFRDFDLWVVDDGSVDSTPEILQAFPEVHYIRLRENRGVSFARNSGLEASQSDYVCFLDSDDLWEQDKLQIQWNWMQSHPDIPVCYTDEIWIRRGVRVNPKKKHRKYSGDILEAALKLCIVSPSSVMLRRSLLNEIGGFDESMPVCEDYDLWLRIARRYPFHFIDQKLIVKRGGHEDQLSRKLWGMDEYRVFAMNKLLDCGELTPAQETLVLKELIHKLTILSKGYGNRGKPERSEHFRTMADRFKKRLHA